MIRRTKTVDVRTKWEVEVFPFESIYPDAEKTGPQASWSFVIESGITGIRINRSKNSPSGQCSFMITGPVPKGCFPGSWIVVSSISAQPNGVLRRLDRFIGQIYSCESEYVVSPDSTAIQSRTTVVAREWSSVFEMPVRYDLFSIMQLFPQEFTSTAKANFKAIGASYEQIREISEKSFNAFELAHYIFTLIGGISDIDKVNRIKDLGDLGLPEVAVRMPSVPKSLLSRLNLPTTSATNPFTTGFADVITGVQQRAINADGNWSGIFATAAPDPAQPVTNVLANAKKPPKPVFAKTPTIAEYKAAFEKEPGNRPITLGLSALASLGGSAWGLINSHCDPAVNEFFTDILYQQKDTGDVLAKPVVFVRDKPFLMRRFKETVASGIDTWTIYDDLPRTRIDTVYIERFRFKNTFINSPNYIRPNFQPQAMDSESAKMLSQLTGVVRLAPEINRFGGQEFFIESQFLSLDVIEGRSTNIPAWFKQLGTLASCWHSYNYRMGDGTLVLRDDNIPVTCGLNVQFRIGEFELVGHVESFDISFTVHPDGRYETVSTVQLSRIVHDYEGQLEFVPPDSMSNLLYDTPSKVDDPPSFKSSLAAVASSVANKLKGLLD